MSSLAYADEINLALSVQDLERSIQWFVEHLGFSVLMHDQRFAWATLGTHMPGLTLGLAQTEAPSPRGGATPTFGVQDIDVARAKLEGAGVRFDGPTHEIPGVTRFATFFDPDGNAFMLAQKLDGHTA